MKGPQVLNLLRFLIELICYFNAKNILKYDEIIFYIYFIVLCIEWYFQGSWFNYELFSTTQMIISFTRFAFSSFHGKNEEKYIVFKMWKITYKLKAWSWIIFYMNVILNWKKLNLNKKCIMFTMLDDHMYCWIMTLISSE